MVHRIRGAMGGCCTSLALAGLVVLAAQSQAAAGINIWTTNGGGSPMVVSPSAPNVLYSGGSAGKVFKSVDSGETWQLMNDGLPSFPAISVLAVDPDNADLVYVANDEGAVFRTSDGAVTWIRASVGFPSGQGAPLQITALATGGGVVYAATRYTGLFRSENHGAIWTIAFATPSEVTAVAVSPDHPQVAYAGTSQALLGTINGGRDWYVFASSIMSPSALGLPPGRDSTIYFALGPTQALPDYLGQGIRWSVDGGGSISAVDQGILDPNVTTLAIDPVDPDNVYAGTLFGGVFRTTDEGATWTALNAGLPLIPVRSLAVDAGHPTRIHAAAGSVYTIEIDDSHPVEVTPTPLPIVSDDLCAQLSPVPTAGPPGTRVQLSGHCTPIHSARPAGIYFDRIWVGTVSGDSGGFYGTTITVPANLEAGTHVISFVQGAQITSAYFDVEAVGETVTPTASATATPSGIVTATPSPSSSPTATTTTPPADQTASPTAFPGIAVTGCAVSSRSGGTRGWPFELTVIVALVWRRRRQRSEPSDLA